MRPASLRTSSSNYADVLILRRLQAIFAAIMKSSRPGHPLQPTPPTCEAVHGPHHGNAEQHVTDHEQDRRQSIGDHHTWDDLVMSTLVRADLTRLSDGPTAHRTHRGPLRGQDLPHGKIVERWDPNGHLDVAPDRRLTDLELSGADRAAVAQCPEFGQQPERVPLWQRFAADCRLGVSGKHLP